MVLSQGRWETETDFDFVRVLDVFGYSGGISDMKSYVVAMLDCLSGHPASDNAGGTEYQKSHRGYLADFKIKR
jgi:hypothetical protein